MWREGFTALVCSMKRSIIVQMVSSSLVQGARYLSLQKCDLVGFELVPSRPLPRSP